MLLECLAQRDATGDERVVDRDPGVIARGGTFIHIVNGQLMAVLVDDDPDSSNNQPGLFGIELESITQLYVRNIWVKKLN